MHATGWITLPVPEPGRTYLRSVRRGEVLLPEVLTSIADVERQLVALQSGADVPAEPDRAWGVRLVAPVVRDLLGRPLTRGTGRGPLLR